MVDVGVIGGFAAAGEAAGEVSATDEVRQPARRCVAGFGWAVARVEDLADFRGEGEASGQGAGEERAAEDGAGAGGGLIAVGISACSA